MPLRLLSLGGLLLSGWLLFQKATGAITYLAGCGAGSGCANVLGSRWSQWFLLPVSALSLLLYALLFFLTFRPQRTALLAIAVSLTGAAIWFSIVQAFILKSFCPWCLSAHAIGLLCAVLIFRKWHHGQKFRALLIGSAATAALLLGQIFGPVPETHQQSDLVIQKPTSPEPTGPVHERGDGRKVTFLGNKQYNPANLPHLGDPNAPHVMVEYYDYTCNFCQELAVDLKALMQKHPGKFCIVLLPCPIERSCNPHVPDHLDDHPNACALARLSLACWRWDRASFPTVHEALFSRPVLDPVKALALANSMMKSPLPPQALSDPWINEILAADAEDYNRVNVTNSGHLNYLMPKLLVGGTRMLHGVTKDRATLFYALEREFGLLTP